LKDTILEELVAVVGSEYATDSPALLERYSRDLSFSPLRQPNYVVLPDTRPQVQEIVRIANRHKMPIIPRSSPVGLRGGAIPELGGIVVDFQRMNRIVAIDHTNWLVAIEPGVTFTHLQTELQKSGFRVAAPLFALSSASVISTYLDREPLITAAYFISPKHDNLGMMIQIEPGTTTLGSDYGPNQHLWLKEIKRVFDPNDTMNPGKLIKMEPPREK
jgi:FAD/FMN-containing dehydrogenase